MSFRDFFSTFLLLLFLIGKQNFFLDNCSPLSTESEHSRMSATDIHWQPLTSPLPLTATDCYWQPLTAPDCPWLLLTATNDCLWLPQLSLTDIDNCYWLPPLPLMSATDCHCHWSLSLTTSATTECPWLPWWLPLTTLTATD